jgi:hypothetical protein
MRQAVKPVHRPHHFARSPSVRACTEHGRVVPSCRLASADLLSQGDDDARGAAEVAEPEDALVLGHLAEEFGAVVTQTGDGVVDGEHDAMQAQRVGRRVLRPGAHRRGAWYFVSSSLLWPSRVRISVISLRTPSSPTVRSARRPLTCPLPSSSMPSSVKHATAASTSPTTIATLSIR